MDGPGRPAGDGHYGSAIAEPAVTPTPVTELDLPELDYTDPELVGDRFHERMAELRSRGWLARHPLGVMVLDREGGEEFLRSKGVGFPMAEIIEIFGIEEGPLREEMSRNIIGIEGDEHRRLRSMVNPSFTPRAARGHREAIRLILDDVLDRGLRGNGCEFVGAVARPFPARVVAHVLGDPDADPESLARWSEVVQRQFDAQALASGREEIEEQVLELFGYLRGLVERAREGGGGLVGELLDPGREGERPTVEEALNLAGNVLIGGIDTTQSQLAQAVRLFAEHPDQWSLLAERPDLAAAAVEEVLRFEPVTPFTARIVREELEIRGVTFPPGTVVLVAAVTANRDTSPAPHEFDITAEREGGKGGRLLTFGAGIHYCLGANLAKVELEEALRVLPARMPGLRLDGEPEFDTVTGIYALNRLPVAWD